MIYLLRKLFGRLALILIFEALTAWFLMIAAHQAWPNAASGLGMVITIFVMFLTVFAYQERKLGSNISWLTTLPLAKNHVWLINYVIRLSAVILVFALLLIIAAFLPDVHRGTDYSKPFISEFFGSLGESGASWLSFYGIKLGSPEFHTLGKSMLFVMILAVTHFYCGVLRLVSGQGKVLNIVLFAGSLWAGFLLLAVAGSSVFTYEAFMMAMAALLMFLSSVRVLQMPVRSCWPMITAIILGWILLISPQVVRAWQTLKNPVTADEFVDAARYFGKTVKITPEMYHRAFRRPVSSWQLRELVNLYTGKRHWNEQAVLPAEGDAIFNFLDTLNAQTDRSAVFSLIQLVKPQTMTTRHIQAFTKHLESLASQEDNDNSDTNVASLVKLSLSDQQLANWLRSDVHELRYAAIIYPRFRPSERNWRMLVTAFNDSSRKFSRHEREQLRISASVIKGKWLERSEIENLDKDSLFAQQINRNLCSESYKALICSTNNSCAGTPQPEVESCYLNSGIKSETMNACLYTYALNSAMYARSGLIRVGWVHPGKDHQTVINTIACKDSDTDNE